MSDTQLQGPDVDVKPRVTIDQVPALVWQLYGFKVYDMKQLPSYNDLNFYFLAEDVTESDYIDVVCPDGYVLKIMNSRQSSISANIGNNRRFEFAEANHAMMRHVQERGVSTPSIILNKSGNDYSLKTFTDQKRDVLGPYVVRLTSFVPGKTFFQTSYIAGSFRNVGQLIGKLHHALEGFHHSFFDTNTTIWSLVEVPALRNFLHAVKVDKDRALVEEVIEDFEKNVKPNLENFRKGIIHGDINDHNLIMRNVQAIGIETSECVHDVAALLDFDDSEKSYRVLDVAIAIAHMSIECPYETQLDVGGHILSSYSKYSSLNVAEKMCLKTLVGGRLCQSLVFGEHAYTLQPGNDYLLVTSKKGWPLLHRLWGTDRDELYSRWDNIASV